MRIAYPLSALPVFCLCCFRNQRNVSQQNQLLGKIPLKVKSQLQMRCNLLSHDADSGFHFFPFIESPGPSKAKNGKDCINSTLGEKRQIIFTKSSGWCLFLNLDVKRERIDPFLVILYHSFQRLPNHLLLSFSRIKVSSCLQGSPNVVAHLSQEPPLSEACPERLPFQAEQETASRTHTDVLVQ